MKYMNVIEYVNESGCKCRIEFSTEMEYRKRNVFNTVMKLLKKCKILSVNIICKGENEE